MDQNTTEITSSIMLWMPDGLNVFTEGYVLYYHANGKQGHHLGVFDSTEAGLQQCEALQRQISEALRRGPVRVFGLTGQIVLMPDRPGCLEIVRDDAQLKRPRLFELGDGLESASESNADSCQEIDVLWL